MENIEVIRINKDDETQCILGHAGFVNAIDDLHEAVISAAPRAKFGLAYSEASGMKLIRSDGTDHVLMKHAELSLQDLGAGHTFIIFFKDAFPIKVLNAIKNVGEVLNIYCATANPIYVAILRTQNGNAVIGVIDGPRASGIERIDDRESRKRRLKNAGKR